MADTGGVPYGHRTRRCSSRHRTRAAPRRGSCTAGARSGSSGTGTPTRVSRSEETGPRISGTGTGGMVRGVRRSPVLLACPSHVTNDNAYEARHRYSTRVAVQHEAHCAFPARHTVLSVYFVCCLGWRTGSIDLLKQRSFCHHHHHHLHQTSLCHIRLPPSSFPQGLYMCLGGTERRLVLGRNGKVRLRQKTTTAFRLPLCRKRTFTWQSFCQMLFILVLRSRKRLEYPGRRSITCPAGRPHRKSQGQKRRSCRLSPHSQPSFAIPQGRVAPCAPRRLSCDSEARVKKPPI